MIKEIKDTNKFCINGKTFHTVQLESFVSLRCPHYPKPSKDLIQTLSKSQWHFFRKKILEYQRTSNTQNNLEKNKGFTHPDLKTYCKATLIQSVWNWHKDIDQLYKIESPEINDHICDQMIFNKGAKNTQWRKDGLFKKWCWENCLPTCKKVNLGPYLTPYTNITSKWFRHLN